MSNILPRLKIIEIDEILDTNIHEKNKEFAFLCNSILAKSIQKFMLVLGDVYKIGNMTEIENIKINDNDTYYVQYIPKTESKQGLFIIKNIYDMDVHLNKLVCKELKVFINIDLLEINKYIDANEINYYIFDDETFCYNCQNLKKSCTCKYMYCYSTND